MFEAWETFYLMLGGSAAALIGMMFVVVTLTAEISVDQINRGTTIYHNPTIFHLGVVLAISAVTMVPEHLIAVEAWVIALVGLGGLVYSGATLARMFEDYSFYRATISDKILYGVLPGLLYLLMAAGAAAILRAPEIAAEIIGTATLLLLLVAVRNAWDVATFAVRVSRSLKAADSGKKETAP